MNQLAIDFDARVLARTDDPATSAQAAQRAVAFKASHEGKIFGVIHGAGARGATMKEIADAIGLQSVQVGRRLGAMGERKVIVRRLNDNPESERDFQSRDGCAIWWVG